MKSLNGAELRDFIKERQAKQVRALRQSWKIFPKLLILRSGESEVVDMYVRLKKKYGEDILIEVEDMKVDLTELAVEIAEAANNDQIHGIIVQLPLKDDQGKNIDEKSLNSILKHIPAEKDVDGLNSSELFTPATAQAINWLLAGYNVELKGKKIAIVGQGKLVGAPLYELWQSSDYDLTIFDENTSEEMKKNLHKFDIVVSATGVAGIIQSQMLKKGAVVVDAGTASEGGVIKGDVSAEVRASRNDLTITPEKGGVGPLTVAALFDNVILAARKIADKKGQQDL